MGGLHSAVRRTGPPSACPVQSHTHLSSQDMIATEHDTGPVRSCSSFASDSSGLRLLLGCSLPVCVFLIQFILLTWADKFSVCTIRLTPLALISGHRHFVVLVFVATLRAEVLHPSDITIFLLTRKLRFYSGRLYRAIVGQQIR
jgi:hypothetical protein